MLIRLSSPNPRNNYTILARLGFLYVTVAHKTSHNFSKDNSSQVAKQDINPGMSDLKTGIFDLHAIICKGQTESWVGWRHQRKRGREREGRNLFMGTHDKQ